MVRAETAIAQESEIRDEPELDRIRAAYRQRLIDIPSDRYARTNPAHLYAIHSQEAALAALLRSAGIVSFAGLRVLDAGCGNGSTLRLLLEYGADPELLTGVDLLPDRVREARRLAPHLKILCGTATQLPFSDASFDFVFQFLVFTSVLNRDMRTQMAGEISRVLVPGGRILWCDFAYDNPKNPHVRGVRRSEIRRLFPDFMITAKRAIAAPPLGRILARFGPALYHLLAQTRVLCTHNVCLMQKKFAA